MKWLKRNLSAQVIVSLWLVGSVGSFFIQSAFQKRFAAGANWVPSTGWQNEIAIWNLGLCFLLVALLGNARFSRKALPALFILSFGFMVNHTYAIWTSEIWSPSNVAGATMNFLAVALITIYFLFNRRESKSKLMKEIVVGDLYTVADTTHLKGTHLVEVLEDTRGGVGGGIKVKSLGNGQESHVRNEELFFYKPWEPYFQHTITALISCLLGAAIGYLIK